jgi:4,5-DOPA dioxygenase extradiol
LSLIEKFTTRSLSITLKEFGFVVADSGKMPVLFVGHGSPMNIISKNGYTEDLAKTAKQLPKPKAILVVSAHWLTSGTYVGCMNKPRTIYDFYGFPIELYKIRYPSPGAPKEAAFVTETVKNAQVKCDADWGLDHASWAVLKHMYPNADVPVFEMSLDYSPYNDWRPKPLEYHYRLAAELAPLRENGVLIIGSGNLVHNLGLIEFDTDAEPYGWAVTFDEKIKTSLLNRNHGALLNYLDFGREAHYAVPTLDHYLPMIYAIALQGKDESLKFIHEGFQNGSVSMRAFQIG